MTTKEGMHVFAVIHSFTQTCRKLRLAPWKQMVNIVRDRDWNIFDEARRQNTPVPAGFRPVRALEYKPCRRWSTSPCRRWSTSPCRRYHDQRHPSRRAKILSPIPLGDFDHHGTIFN